MRKYLTLIALIVLVCFRASAQQDTLLKHVVSSLKQRNTNEKVYLHFDKSDYFAGDTLYFKAYVTMGDKHQLSSISSVLHVNLITPQNRIYKSITLPLGRGMAHGDFTLSDSLTEGYYRIRAYTNWMRNNDDALLFDEPISVHSALKVLRKTAITPNAKPDLQFFPEGGDMLTNVTGKVAFKAIDLNGMGLDVKGNIIDAGNKVVAAFASAHAGMGAFFLKPLQGHTYKAAVSYPNGIRDTINLPLAKARGIVVKIDNDSTTQARLQLVANDKYFAENKDRNINLLIYSGGHATTLYCKLDSPTVSLALMKKQLPSGITRITVFEPNGQPASERLIFIKNDDLLNLTLNSDKKIYNKGEQACISLQSQNAKDATRIAYFSAAIINDSKTDNGAPGNILSYLLLTSELKGTIENPDYYFDSPSDKTMANLDLVMLTHGYRNFSWQQLTSTQSKTPLYQPEGGIEIVGVAKIKGKPAPKAIINLVLKSGTPLSDTTDNNGNFKFKNLLFSDAENFVLQAVNENVKLSYRTLANEPVVQPVNYFTQIPQITAADSAQALRLERDKILKGQMLKEVHIKDVKMGNQYRSSSIIGPGHADQVIHMDDVKTAGTLDIALQGRLHGIQVTNGKAFFLMYPMVVYLDGAEFTGPLEDIPTADIETVEVLKTASATAYGMNGGHGVIVLTSRQGTASTNGPMATNMLPIRVPGFYRAREFYAPKYTAEPAANLNATVYWQPDVITNNQGAAAINFRNGNTSGGYRVIIEGIDEAGHIGRAVYRYAVR